MAGGMVTRVLAVTMQRLNNESKHGHAAGAALTMPPRVRNLCH